MCTVGWIGPSESTLPWRVNAPRVGNPSVRDGLPIRWMIYWDSGFELANPSYYRSAIVVTVDWVALLGAR